MGGLDNSPIVTLGKGEKRGRPEKLGGGNAEESVGDMSEDEEGEHQRGKGVEQDEAQEDRVEQDNVQQAAGNSGGERSEPPAQPDVEDDDGPEGIPQWRNNPNYLTARGRNRFLKTIRRGARGLNSFLYRPRGVKQWDD